MTKKGSKKPPPPAKAGKKKQLEIAGTERKRVPEVEDLAESYRLARNERMAKQQTELELQEKIRDTMKRLGMTRHVYEDEDGAEQEVFVDDVVKVKVRKVKKPTADAE